MSPLRPRPVRALTRRLVFAAIVPGWVLALVMVWSAYQRERDNRLDAMLQTARAMVYQADRELGNLQHVVRCRRSPPRPASTRATIAASTSARAKRSATAVATTSCSSTPRCRGASASRTRSAPPRLAVRHDRFPTVMSSLQPAVSDLFIGEVSRQPQVAVAVPVVREGRAIARLEMVFKPARFQQIIERQGFDPG
ncbi:MAG: hypothetical protein KF891_01705 [Rhizobacter sp.]|nr:hypothetical protein [Rhizobacter sp.]